MKEIKNKSAKMLQVEEQKGEMLEEILRKLYVDENKSTEDIANILQVSYVTAYKWLKLAGIYSRKLKL